MKSVTRHPDAEKLNVCRVWNGREELQIVCGAPNVRVGMKAPLALIGAKLPNGMEIKQAKLRGVESSGMLCSARELGLSEDASGLFDLPAVLQAGQDLVAALRPERYDFRSEPHAESRRLHERRRRRARSRGAAQAAVASACDEAGRSAVQGTLSGAARRRRGLPEVRRPRRSRHSHAGEVAVLDAGAVASCGAASDQRRRRRDELRDARAGRSRCTRTTSTSCTARSSCATPARARRSRCSMAASSS